MKTLYRNRDWLHQKYHTERRSAPDIARVCGCTSTTIYRWMCKLEITRRGPSEAQSTAFPPELLERLYWDEGLSTRQIGDRLGVTGSTVCRWMQRLDIPRRKIDNATALRITGGGPHRDPEWLERRYWQDGCHMGEMAREAGVTRETIWHYMHKYSIAIRTRGQARCLKPSGAECAMMDMLDGMGVDYDFQYPIGRLAYDFHIAHTNILIEVDGVFWHHSEWAREHGAPARDARKAQAAEQRGYLLVRITDQQLYEEPDTVEKALHQLGRQHGLCI